MAKFLKGRIKKLEGCRKKENDDKRWLEIFREQSLRSLDEVLEKAGIKPIAKEDYTNNEEGLMDSNVLRKTIRRIKEEAEKKS